jgi:hypothetical protein
MRSQRGSVALIALVFLLFLAVIGASWLPLLNTEAQHARMDSDEQLAWYAAEAGYKRAYAGFKNEDGLGDWNWLTDDTGGKISSLKSNDTYATVTLNYHDIIINNNKVQYAVLIKKQGQSFDEIENNKTYDIVAVGRSNGVVKVIQEGYIATNSSGGEVANEKQAILSLLLKEAINTDIKIDGRPVSVNNYFRSKGAGKALNSLGSNFAQYINKSFWDLINENLDRNKDVTILHKENGEYDIAQEHYLWRIYATKANSASGLTEGNIFWAYVGNVLDDCYWYRENPASNTSTNWKNDFYNKYYTKRTTMATYVSVDANKFTNNFLPYSKWENKTGINDQMLWYNDVKDIENYAGNPIACYIKSGSNIKSEGQFVTTVIPAYLTGVYKFVYNINSSSILDDSAEQSSVYLNAFQENDTRGNNMFVINGGSWGKDSVVKFPLGNDEILVFLKQPEVIKVLKNVGWDYTDIGGYLAYKEINIDSELKDKWN